MSAPSSIATHSSSQEAAPAVEAPAVANAPVPKSGESLYVLRFRERHVSEGKFTYTPWTKFYLHIEMTSSQDIATMHALLFHFQTFLSDACVQANCSDVVFYDPNVHKDNLETLMSDVSVILEVSFKWFNEHNEIIEQREAVHVYEDYKHTFVSIYLGYALMDISSAVSVDLSSVVAEGTHTGNATNTELESELKHLKEARELLDCERAELEKEKEELEQARGQLEKDRERMRKANIKAQQALSKNANHEMSSEGDGSSEEDDDDDDEEDDDDDDEPEKVTSNKKRLSQGSASGVASKKAKTDVRPLNKSNIQAWKGQKGGKSKTERVEHLKQQYVNAFGKSPQGRFASDPKWLASKLKNAQ